MDQLQEEIDRIAKDGVDDARNWQRVKAVLRFDKITGLQSSLAAREAARPV